VTTTGDPDKRLGKVGADAPIEHLLDIGQRAARNPPLDAHVIELARLRDQARIDEWVIHLRSVSRGAPLVQSQDSTNFGYVVSKLGHARLGVRFNRGKQDLDLLPHRPIERPQADAARTKNSQPPQPRRLLRGPPWGAHNGERSLPSPLAICKSAVGYACAQKDHDSLSVGWYGGTVCLQPRNFSCTGQSETREPPRWGRSTTSCCRTVPRCSQNIPAPDNR